MADSSSPPRRCSTRASTGRWCLICEHSEEGALGIVQNRPGELLVADAVPEDALTRTSRARAFGGLSGWGPGQLEAELAGEDWIVVDGEPDDVFCPDPGSHPPPRARRPCAAVEHRARRAAQLGARPNRLPVIGATRRRALRLGREQTRKVAMVTSVFDPRWDAEENRPPFRWRRARLGRQAGSEKLGASLYELPPGASMWPMHIHHANEELLIVLAGCPTLRSADGERVLQPGEVVSCPAGPRGAHRIDNHSAEAARLLVVSTMIAPELNEYPDSGKLWGLGFPPGGEHGPDTPEIVGRPEDNLDYFEGES